MKDINPEGLGSRIMFPGTLLNRKNRKYVTWDIIMYLSKDFDKVILSEYHRNSSRVITSNTMIIIYDKRSLDNDIYESP
ncbi:hypothetical protein, partial [Escherichia coli]|uniref:hypothetical protein n=1 Tax=Escherichia coli TaxID=562 RepID=UPI001C59B128